MNAWAWLLQRVSAVLLFLLVGFHIWRLHIDKILTLNLVTSRVELLIFIMLDLLLLAVGMFHGMNGLYAVLVDFGLEKNVVTITVISLCTVSIVLLGIGTYALLQLIS
ncbi:hypothetical protein ACFLTY_03100 [Chloroflexota bacterium]